MLLTNSINTGKFVMCLDEQELNLIGIAIRELRDAEIEESTPLDTILRVDSATFAESLWHQEKTLGVDHGCDNCDGCNGCDEEPVPDWMDGDEKEN